MSTSIYTATSKVCYQLTGPIKDKVDALQKKDKKYGAKFGTCQGQGFLDENKTNRKWDHFIVTRWTKGKTAEEESFGDFELWENREASTYHSVIQGAAYCLEYQGQPTEVTKMDEALKSRGGSYLESGSCAGRDY